MTVVSYIELVVKADSAGHAIIIIIRYDYEDEAKMKSETDGKSSQLRLMGVVTRARPAGSVLRGHDLMDSAFSYIRKRVSGDRTAHNSADKQNALSFSV